MAAALLVLLGSPATSMAASGAAGKVRPRERRAGVATRRPPKPRGLLRKVFCRRDCAGRRAGATRTTSTAVAPRPAARDVGPRRFASAAELPPPRRGTVRLYRGSGHPDRVQVSRSLRGRPAAEVPRGDQQFFDLVRGSEIARLHAQGAETHPDAVSMTSDLSTATSVARSHDGAVMVYDLPADLVDRLPRGDRTMGEYIIKYSIPTDYLVGIIPAPRRR